MNCWPDIILFAAICSFLSLFAFFAGVAFGRLVYRQNKENDQ
jgi:hypothetical protein